MAGEFKFRLDQIKKDLDPVRMASLAYPVFMSNTPRRTGNAQSNTILRKDAIEANYPYAKRLDEGYSNLKPDGMTKPTAKWFQQYIRRISK
jgi:hypothetical protein